VLDPIVNFFTRIFQAIGRGIGLVIAWLLWPFMAFGRWYSRRGWLIKGPIGIGLILLFAFYAYFVWNTQVWSNFDPDYPDGYNLVNRNVSAGEQVNATNGDDTKTCGRSAIADITIDLIDLNVNENAWISSMLLYKLGLFGVDWDHTPFLDNKASFQRGVNQAIRRTTVELVDTLGRIRHLADRQQSAGCARKYAVRRAHLVFRPQPVRAEDADAELLQVGHARPQDLQRPARKM